MHAYDLQLTDTPERSAIDTISTQLDDFNIAATGIIDRRPLAILLREHGTGQVIGGLSGRTSMGLLFIDLFYLPEGHRGNGLGSRILQMAEDEARQRGCRFGVLYTISFQAPDFYRRHGWETFGDVPSEPPGTSRVFLRKAL